MSTIITLVVIGFILVAAEMFLPGLVLGIIGALMLISAIVMGFTQFGIETGTIIFVVVLLGTTSGFFVWMSVFPKTTVGRKLTLGTSLSGHSDLPDTVTVGQEGTALTPLRPAGTALINQTKVDVIAESSFIEAREPVVVLAAQGSRVVVRKKI